MLFPFQLDHPTGSPSYSTTVDGHTQHNKLPHPPTKKTSRQGASDDDKPKLPVINKSQKEKTARQKCKLTFRRL